MRIRLCLMKRIHRRSFLKMGGASLGAAALPTFLREIAAISATSASGTIADVKHVVILIQENRSFDHYFGTMRGVRGFGDRFTVPQRSGQTVWHQRGAADVTILPFHLDSRSGNAQRVAGGPHHWDDAHAAWNHGSFGSWALHKEAPSMGYFTATELAFQFALADAFTVCDAYHCSIQGCTNPNRLFAFTGTNDPFGKGGGPAIDNTNDDLGAPALGYTWTTYAERLEAAGVSWKVYQDMHDNFTNNPLEGFRSFREALASGGDSALVQRGLSSPLSDGTLAGLRADVVAGKLPQVTWIVAPERYSEHPGPSSPVQGGYFAQQVLEALTADRDVWSKTVLFITYDENDAFFDHVPPPCPPSRVDGQLAGASTVDDASERHPSGVPYGPGPRVPLFVVSPFSRGGWVNSQAFDHTSILRFLEARFGVHEPNISPFRRAMFGDLTSAFNFASPNSEVPPFISCSRDRADALRAAQEKLSAIHAPVDSNGSMPPQEPGVRPSRALPYELNVEGTIADNGKSVALEFVNSGGIGAVFHVYDRNHLTAPPRRYAVEAGKAIVGRWPAGGAYDLWVLGPNGFHRRFEGRVERCGSIGSGITASVAYDGAAETLIVRLKNESETPKTFVVTDNAYRSKQSEQIVVGPKSEERVIVPVAKSGRWYDTSVRVEELPEFHRRFAGRIENGKPSTSDPAVDASIV